MHPTFSQFQGSLLALALALGCQRRALRRRVAGAWVVALEYGMVGMSVGTIATAHVPFGGVKQSGLGRQGSRHGMEESWAMKPLCLGRILRCVQADAWCALGV